MMREQLSPWEAHSDEYAAHWHRKRNIVLLIRLVE